MFTRSYWIATTEVITWHPSVNLSYCGESGDIISTLISVFYWIKDNFTHFIFLTTKLYCYEEWFLFNFLTLASSRFVSSTKRSYKRKRSSVVFTRRRGQSHCPSGLWKEEIRGHRCVSWFDCFTITDDDISPEMKNFI